MCAVGRIRLRHGGYAAIKRFSRKNKREVHYEQHSDLDRRGDGCVLPHLRHLGLSPASFAQVPGLPDVNERRRGQPPRRFSFLARMGG